MGSLDAQNSLLQCSICLDAVADDGKRSWAKLRCGHQFHLDCIGSAFNVKNAMQCPNCREIERGEWLYAAQPVLDYGIEDWHFDDFVDRAFSEVSYGLHWCPVGGLAQLQTSLNERIRLSPPTTFTNLVGPSIMYTDHGAVSSATHPYITYVGPLHPSSSNPGRSTVPDNVGFIGNWSVPTVHSEVPTSYTFPTMDIHYQNWEHHSSPFPNNNSSSSSSSHIAAPDQSSIASLNQRAVRTNQDLQIPASYMNPLLVGNQDLQRPASYMNPLVGNQDLQRPGSYVNHILVGNQDLQRPASYMNPLVGTQDLQRPASYVNPLHVGNQDLQRPASYMNPLLVGNQDLQRPASYMNPLMGNQDLQRPASFMNPVLVDHNTATGGTSTITPSLIPPYRGSFARTQDRVQALETYFQQGISTQTMHSANGITSIPRSSSIQMGSSSSTQVAPMAAAAAAAGPSSSDQAAGFYYFPSGGNFQATADNHHLSAARIGGEWETEQVVAPLPLPPLGGGNFVLEREPGRVPISYWSDTTGGGTSNGLHQRHAGS